MRSSGSLLCVCDVHGEREEGLCGLYAWSVVDTETAGTVSSGKVELEIGLRWIFGRQVFFVCSFALFVRAVDPDDGSCSRCDCRSRGGRESENSFAGIRVGLRKSCWRSMRRREDIVMKEGSRESNA